MEILQTLSLYAALLITGSLGVYTVYMFLDDYHPVDFIDLIGYAFIFFLMSGFSAFLLIVLARIGWWL